MKMSIFTVFLVILSLESCLQGGASSRTSRQLELTQEQNDLLRSTINKLAREELIPQNTNFELTNFTSKFPSTKTVVQKNPDGSTTILTSGTYTSLGTKTFSASWTFLLLVVMLTVLTDTCRMDTFLDLFILRQDATL
ncbi:uncharacterized protein LOC110844317 [Folsomia candida]|uniref:Uncharacterized protein n=1 Tax=Folsomia candida TaxID=158441 RepID=A0A226EV40_FOLCA|nr:uncharacterized protein LOC110844317 [Folsomia candida]OXA61078.1 hypothetical protein Fcan01_06288 [Folsomia candida]